jgi:hypothetical protein
VHGGVRQSFDWHGSKHAPKAAGRAILRT